MTVTRETIEQVEALRRVNLETDIVQVLAERYGLKPEEALSKYYESELSGMVDRNDFGVQYLDARYLVDQMFPDPSHSTTV